MFLSSVSFKFKDVLIFVLGWIISSLVIYTIISLIATALNWNWDFFNMRFNSLIEMTDVALFIISNFFVAYILYRVIEDS